MPTYKNTITPEKKKELENIVANFKTGDVVTVTYKSGEPQTGPVNIGGNDNWLVSNNWAVSNWGSMTQLHNQVVDITLDGTTPEKEGQEWVDVDFDDVQVDDYLWVHRKYHEPHKYYVVAYNESGKHDLGRLALSNTKGGSAKVWLSNSQRNDFTTGFKFVKRQGVKYTPGVNCLF